MKKLLSMLLILSSLTGITPVQAAFVNDADTLVGTVESKNGENLDFYVSAENHKIYWGGGIYVSDSLSDENYSLLIAIYDNNRLIYSDMSKIDECISDFVFSEQIVRLSYIPEDVSAKAFLWTDTGKCVPLCEAVEMRTLPRKSKDMELFSLDGVNKYLSILSLSSYPELVYKGSELSIDGTFEFELDGVDYYDIIMNVKIGDKTVYSKKLNADSRMSRISVYEPVEDVEVSDMLYLEMDFIHNNNQLKSTVKTDIIDGYATIYGRITDIDADNVATVSIEKSDDFFGEKISEPVTIEAKLSDNITEITKFVYCAMKLDKDSQYYYINDITLSDTNTASLCSNEIDKYYGAAIAAGGTVYNISDYAAIYVNNEAYEGSFDDFCDLYIKYNTSVNIMLADTRLPNDTVADGLYDYVFAEFSESVCNVVKLETNDCSSFYDTVINTFDGTEYILSSNAEYSINNCVTDEYYFKDVIYDNKDEKLTLIDYNNDNIFDKAEMIYRKWAVVDSVVDSGSIIKIYLDDVETGLSPSFSCEDDKCTFIKNGKAAQLSDIKEDDVLLIAYNINGIFKESDFFDIYISDKVVTGTVTETLSENGRSVYVINGTKYKLTNDIYGKLIIDNSYKLYLDASGIIVRYEELASSKNYSIIDRVYYDSNTGEYKVRVINADATRVSYVVKDEAVRKTASYIAYGDEDELDGAALTDLSERVISYKLNSSEEIYKIVYFNTIIEKDEYSENSYKIGVARMNDATQIINLTKIYGKNEYSESDIKPASLSSFIDGEEYTVIAADKNTDGYYNFVIIIEGNSIGILTGFAVVDSVSNATYEYDGTTIKTITVFSADSNGEKLEFFLDKNISNEDEILSLKRGDVIVYDADENNVITECNVLFTKLDASANYVSYEDAVIKDWEKIDDPKWKVSFYMKSGIAKWDTSNLDTSNGYARVGFGAILDKRGSTLTIGEIAQATASTLIDADNDGVNDVYIAVGNYYSSQSEMAELTLAPDVNVYVYDYNYKNTATSGRLSKGAPRSIMKTPVSASLLYKDAKRDYVYDWTYLENEDLHANFAYFKTVNDEITDILVIIPRD